MLSIIMNDIVYHSNIALMNSIKECLREDFGLLDKITEPINLHGIQNFQNNGIQTSYLFHQNFMKSQNKIYEKEDDKLNCEYLAPNEQNFLRNNLVNDNYFIQIIGLKISLHPEIEKLNKNLKEHFKCASVSIIKLKDNISYGTRICYENEENMNKAMNSSKLHKIKLDDMCINLKKKLTKEGNRLYAIYLENDKNTNTKKK